MFIYSVRASTLRFFCVLAATVCLLVGIMVFSGGDSVFAMSDGAYRFSDVTSKEDRLAVRHSRCRRFGNRGRFHDAGKLGSRFAFL